MSPILWTFILSAASAACAQACAFRARSRFDFLGLVLAQERPILTLLWRSVFAGTALIFFLLALESLGVSIPTWKG